MDFGVLGIKDIKKGIMAGEFSAKDVALQAIKACLDKNPEVNAYISIDKEGAVAAADEIDKKIAEGKDPGPLCGAPIAVKDNILTEGGVTTSASKILKNYVAPYDATVVKKLKSAGAILAGKANMDEFAMGSSTENSAYGPVRNPRDIDRVPGGSSGGSAAAVAANTTVGALGSDTGGSIRLPASFCGVVGMKPTYGRVSRFGLMAMASSLDQIGPFGKTVADAEEIYSVIKGADKRDATSKDAAESQLPFEDMKSITIGIPDEYFPEGGLDKDTAGAMDEVISFFRGSGVNIKKISLPNSKYALSAYYIIMFAEVATNLARFDGIRYSRDTEEKDLLEMYLKTRGEGFGSEVKRRILLGTFVLSSGYYDAYYAKAQKVRQLIKSDFIEAFKDIDLILTPTSPTVPFKLGEKINDPVQMYLSDIFTVPVNLAGLPAISIPAKGRENKLPVGFQLIARHWHDSDLFGMGKYYEET